MTPHDPTAAPLPDGAATLGSLRRMVTVRWWVLAFAAALVLAVPALLPIRLPVAVLLALVLVAVAWNAVWWRRLRHAATATPAEIFIQLCFDLLLLAALLFFSGGATNPLVSLLLPPVVVAALTLPARQVGAVGALAIAAYSLLMHSFLPLPLDDPAHGAHLHLVGMWLTFVVSVVLVGGFILRMTATLRERDAELAAIREQALRDERVLALGALAAGAAHELGTPLATMAVLAGELRADPRLGADAQADLDLLRGQIAHCKKIISGLAERAGVERLERAARLRCDDWLESLHARWRDRRGAADSVFEKVGSGVTAHAGTPPDMGTAPVIAVEPTLEQGITNLLDNAQRAGGPVTLRVAWDAAQLVIEVADRGPGFPAAVLQQGGQQPFAAHAAGSGIGLLLTRAAIERLGGRLALSNRPKGDSDAGGATGGLARITLPLTGLPS